jgi:hypothetical protein
MSDAAVKIIVALIGAVAGIVGTYLAFVLPERKKRPQLIANFLDVIAKSVMEMIAMFERDEIPSEAGNELYSTIAFFEEGTHR